jgi:hypothetical protein
VDGLRSEQIEEIVREDALSRRRNPGAHTGDLPVWALRARGESAGRPGLCDGEGTNIA